MKFSVEKSVLIEGLSKVEKMVAKKDVIPILTHILFDVKEDGITLASSDSQRSIKTNIYCEDAEIIAEGAAAIPKQIVDIVKRLNSTIHFELENHTLIIKSGNSNFRLNVMDADQFPTFPEVSGATVRLPGSQFVDLISQTHFCAAQTESRPVLQGIYFQLSQQTLTTTATDSHRLAQIQVSIDTDQDLEINCPIHSKTLFDITRIFERDEDIEISLARNEFMLKQGKTVIMSRVLDGTYPDVSRVIPNQFKTNIVLNRKEWIQTLQQVSIFGEDKEKSVVFFRVDGMTCVQTSQETQTGFAKSELFYSKLEGDEDVEVAFNGKFVLEALQSMDCTEVVMQFKHPLNPFIIRPRDSETNQFHLILPVRRFN